MARYAFTKDSTAGILRGLRATARLSQEELARKSGVGLASIKGYENGENVMSLENAAKLANAFDVAVSDLVQSAS